MQATAGLLRSTPALQAQPWASRHRLPAWSFRTRRLARQSQSGTLTEKRCEPCEPTTGSLSYMGLCMALSKQEAEEMLSKDEVQGWKLHEDEQARLQILKQWKSKNFMKALELCNRFGEIAEQEQHHPDLHVTGWNNVEAKIWTHARDGLTENDFILAAKLNSVPKDDLLRKPKKSTQI